MEGGAGECSEGKKVLGQTLVPRHLEPQRVKAKASSFSILIVLGEFPVLRDRGALITGCFYSTKSKEVGPLRSLCPGMWVTLAREGSPPRDLLCKMVEESLK